MYFKNFKADFIRKHKVCGRRMVKVDLYTLYKND